MVFSSHIFLFYFLPVSLAAYYLAPQRWRHLLLTLLSCVFYGWWNPWFVLLMLGSIVVDYGCGKIISAEGASQRQRKTGLLLSVTSNLSLLGFFKYCGFAVGAASDLAQALGWHAVTPPAWVTSIVLPVGISFYVFQSMSYCIDLYRRDAQPARSLIDFACYVTLYPQLVAGPIVRYASVAAQLRSREHTAPGFVLGLSRFSLGFAKKILLANPMGPLAEAAFGAHPEVLGATTAWIGVVAYAFQIYFDFSAYSDMAVGLGRMFGFHFIENFESPYRAASLTEFWRRWHISLSTFLRDYLYIPLGGNRLGPARTYVNLMTVMVLGGLWHGAQWTFVLWGALHGGLLALERWLGGKNPLASMPRPVRVAATFVLVLGTWVFFRAETAGAAADYFRALAGLSGKAETASLLVSELTTPYALFSLLVCAAVTWLAPSSCRFLERLTAWKAALCLALLVVAVVFMSTQGFNPFLYFQF